MSEFAEFEFASAPVKVRRVDPEVLRSGEGLEEALAEAEEVEVEQAVYDRRAARLRGKEIERRQAERIAKASR